MYVCVYINIDCCAGVNIPGQPLAMQNFSSTLDPGQVAPPHFGAGVVHVRVLLVLPVGQGQGVHIDHRDQWPSPGM